MISVSPGWGTRRMRGIPGRSGAPPFRHRGLPDVGIIFDFVSFLIAGVLREEIPGYVGVLRIQAMDNAFDERDVHYRNAVMLYPPYSV